MKLRIRSLSGSVLRVSLFTALLLALLLIWCDVAPWRVAVILTVVVLFNFFLGKFIFNRFVLFRIKPIYQILLSKNIKTNEIPQSGDWISSIESELSNREQMHEREIARLKENEQYRKEFLGDVSHEIKTPIFTIQGYILTLLDGGMEDTTINRKYLERSEKSIDRLINIVHDLEEISKLEAGSLLLERERFDLLSLCREIAEGLEIKAQEREITLRIGSLSEMPVWVNADRNRISQVITNLLSNSIKYGKVGGSTKMNFIDGFDKVMVEVQDNGVGIAPEHISRVFERFFRVDKSRSREQGGTGLGLAIVKHIIEAHGERITLRSTLHEGSTFYFSLPKKG